MIPLIMYAENLKGGICKGLAITRSGETTAECWSEKFVSFEEGLHAANDINSPRLTNPRNVSSSEAARGKKSAHVHICVQLI